MGLGYWPPEVPDSDDLDSFAVAFAALRYEWCDNGELQVGFEKVAIYAEGQTVKHMARQLSSGRWTSKIGRDIDIEHEIPEALEGNTYGSVVRFMRRPSIS